MNFYTALLTLLTHHSLVEGHGVFRAVRLASVCPSVFIMPPP